MARASDWTTRWTWPPPRVSCSSPVMAAAVRESKGMAGLPPQTIDAFGSGAYTRLVPPTTGYLPVAGPLPRREAGRRDRRLSAHPPPIHANSRESRGGMAGELPLERNLAL